MKVLIVDDENLARKRILKILQNRNGISLIEASSGSEAVSKIKSELPDIVFLDIKMTDFSGFEVLKKIDPPILPITVFVTAFDDYAIEAFEIQAIDYVLKPYKESRVLDALENAVLKAETNQKSNNYDEMHSRFDQLLNHLQDVKKPSKGFLEKIVLKVGRKYLFAYTKDIKYITSSAYYAELFMIDGKKHVYRTSMTTLMEKLDPNSFLRLNRSTIIQIHRIKEVVSEGYGDYCVVMMDDQKFNVSKGYKTAFVNQLNLRKS
ncbi:LytR/AlgR family response regulator transcription factor [Flagellimonas sp. S174]|uniref:LytR/AlgR family response regulator transcription factor n=1 Tax=Flagellimonas sp. S174 TaxID=3410790 RepID=UPI003BF5C889